MQKNLNFDSRYTLEVKEERIKGFLFKMKPMKDDGTGTGTDVVCDIANLNRIDIDVKLRRAKGESGQHEETVMFAGSLEDYLVALYGQTTKFELNKKKTVDGYLTFIDLSPSVIALRGKDELVINVNIPKTAFTGTTVSKSSLEFHSVASSKTETREIPVVKAFPIGNGEQNFDKFLGNGIIKIVAGTDFTAAYEASQKAKLVSGDVKGIGNGGPYEKAFTEPVALAENMHYFDNNPESDVQDLVLYWERNPLNKAHLRFKLNKPADLDAKVLTLSLEGAR